MVSQSSSAAASSGSLPHSPTQFDPDMHALQPVVLSYDAGELAPAPFENKTRYIVVWLQVERRYVGPPALTYWVSMNALAPTMPTRPSTFGPYDCYCDRAREDDVGVGRFGLAQHDTWVWQPDWIRERADSRYYGAYVPDVFSGEGPCAKRDVRGLLTQWDPTWITQGDNHVSFSPTFIAQMGAVISLDEEVERRLQLQAPVSSPVLPGQADAVVDLREWWAGAARDIVKRRGFFSSILIGARRWAWIASHDFELHAKMLDGGYYALGPLGVWVEDTAARLVAINEFLRLGVPVFFKWSQDLIINPLAQKLIPPQRLFPQGPKTPPRQRRPLPAVVSPRRRSPPTPENKESKKTHLAESSDDDFDYDDPALEEVFTPGRTNNSARVRLPREAEAVFITDWVTIPFAGRYSSAPLPGQSDRVRGDVVLPRVRALTNTPAPDVPSAPPSLEERLNSDEPPPVPRRLPLVIRSPPSLRIFDDGRAMSVLRAESDKNGNLTAADIVQLALAHGLQFRTPVYVSNPDESVGLKLHVVPDSFTIDGRLSPARMVDAWESNIRKLAVRPHVLRAALMLGGIYARIAKDFLPDDYEFPFGPTRPVVDYGVPLLYQVAHSDSFPLHDDYLSEDERFVFLGLISESDGSQKTMWPKEEVMRSERYLGVWTGIWDTWYKQYLRELRSDRIQPRAYHKWKSLVRGLANKDSGKSII